MAKDPTKLTDEQWKKIEPHIPKFKRSRKGGRKPIEDRRIFEGILWVLRSGARWKDLPKEYPSASTCWRRLRGGPAHRAEPWPPSGHAAESPW